LAEHTLLEFAEAPREPTPKAPRATICATCAQHFSPETRFCPFDGHALVPAADWDPANDPLLGTVIDQRYQVERVVGGGGMGLVYAVCHTKLGKRFALKALRADLASEPEVAQRFIQEARTAAAVEHPGLVETTDFGHLPSGQPYFVMEFLEGESLSQTLRRTGPLPVSRALEITRQAAAALFAAHEHGIVHRDVKPDNIHLGSSDGAQDRVKVVDFGLARVAGASRRTKSGVVFGTPHYMSPEQASGDATDQRSDIYALGAVMYEMVCGRPPFEADTYMGVLSQHLYNAPTPPTEIRPDTPLLREVEPLILRCLEKDPASRYQTLKELLEAVAALFSDPRFAKSPEPRRSPRKERARAAGTTRATAGVPSTPLWPKVFFATAVLSSLIGVAIAAHSKYSAKARERSLAASTADRRVLAAPVPADTVQPPAAAVSVPVASETVAPAASVPPRSSALALARPNAVTRNPVLRSKPSPARRTTSRLGGSEIVDPWAR
jgi:serine/threonine-protein kinase